MAYNHPSVKRIVKDWDKEDKAKKESAKANMSRLKKELEAHKIRVEFDCDSKKTPLGIVHKIILLPPASIKDLKARKIDLEVAMGRFIEITQAEEENTVYILVKNKKDTVSLLDLIDMDQFQSALDMELPVVAGIDNTGRLIYLDITQAPHILIAGTTGSGKSVFIDDIITSLIYRTPEEVKLLLVDPKRVQFDVYSQLPHVIGNILSDSDESMRSLMWLEDEMMRRMDIFGKYHVKDLKTYNHKNDPANRLPRIVAIIDEYKELVDSGDHYLVDIIKRIASYGRQTGIHLIIATQVATNSVITQDIKANIPYRIAFTTVDKRETKAILESSGGVRLLGSGDMLISFNDNNPSIHAQAPYISLSEIEQLVKKFRDKNKRIFNKANKER